MKKLFSCLLLFMSFQEISAQSKAELKADALAFSLEVVENYFKGDCEKGFAFFANEIFTLEGDAPFLIAEKKEKFCNSLSKAIRVKSKWYVNYLNDYVVSVQYLKKFLKSTKAEIQKGVTIEKNDIVFCGFEQRDKSVEKYIWDDMFVFVVRKVNGEWKIVGVGG